MSRLIHIFLRLTGLVLVAVGLIAAFYGPLEIFVFYLFSDGGRFYYAGFGFGSLWFAALVVQNIGYYVIAALCLPLGIGHLKLRRWALTIARLYGWFWLGAGLLLVVNFLLLVPTALRLDLGREALLFRMALVGLASLIFLVLLPLLALWFYHSEKVSAAFARHDSNTYWTERYPLRILSLLLLLLIIILVLHIAIFFQGLVPLFGQVLLGRQSARVMSMCILVAGVLTYGIARRAIWAWWGALVYTALLALSSLLTFWRYSFYDLVSLMDLPATEMEFIDRMALLRDFHLVAVFVVPLLVAFGLVLCSKRYFMKGDDFHE